MNVTVSSTHIGHYMEHFPKNISSAWIAHLINTVSHNASRRAVGAVCPAVAPTMQLLMVLWAVRSENAAAPQACPETVVVQIQHNGILTIWQTWPAAVAQFLGHPGLLWWGE